MSEPFGSGSAGSAGGDAGTIGAAPTESAGSPGATSGQSSQGSDSSTSSGNGAWNELLGIIPREFHPVVTPHLQKFDSNYGQLSQQYAPWKKAFADKGLTPEELLGAQTLYDTINSNPEFVYQQLGQHLERIRAAQPGYVPQEQNQQQAPGAQGVGGSEVEEDGMFDDPRLTSMYEQLQQMNNYLMQQSQAFQQQQAAAQQNAMTADYEKYLDTGIRAIMAKDANVDVGDLLQRAYVQVAQGSEPDLQKAYAEQQAFVQRIRSIPSAGSQAPRVMPTGGGLPPTIDTSRPKTTAEKAARVQQLIDAAMQQ